MKRKKKEKVKMKIVERTVETMAQSLIETFERLKKEGEFTIDKINGRPKEEVGFGYRI